MKTKIEHPDWERDFYNCGYGVKLSGRAIDKLEKWFNTHVTPINKLLAAGVEVYSPHATCRYGITSNATRRDTHKALLINIQPIERETAEDILRDLVNELDGYNLSRFVDRAKAILGGIND